VRAWGDSAILFTVLAVALVIYGIANVAAIAGGVWFTAPKPKAVPAVQPS
jgi:hypothetical protein